MSHLHSRSERIAQLLSLRAPLSLVTNEARMLLRSQEQSDLEWGFGVTSRWPALAIWGMACLLNQQNIQIRDLKRQVRDLNKRKKAQKQEGEA